MVMQPSLADVETVGEDVRSSFPAVYDRTGPWRTITEPVNAPAAGANWSLNLSTNREVRLDMVTCLFVTSAVAANRGPVLQILNESGTIIAQIGLTAAIAASSSYRLTWFKGAAGTNNMLNNQTNALPDIPLEPGCKLQTVTAGIDVGDQYSLIAVTYKLR